MRNTTLIFSNNILLHITWSAGVRRCSSKLVVLKNFANFSGKHQHKLAKLAKISCQISKIFKNTFLKEHLRSQLLYILYTHDITCNLSRWNNGYNGNYKKDQKNEKIVFWNKFYLIFHFLSQCVFISIQNIGRSIPYFLKNSS